MSLPTHAELESLYRQLSRLQLDSDALQKRLDESRREAASGSAWKPSLEKWRQLLANHRAELARQKRDLLAQQLAARNAAPVAEAEALLGALAASLGSFQVEHAPSVIALWARAQAKLADLEGPVAGELRSFADSQKRAVDEQGDILRHAAEHDGRDQDGERAFRRLEADAQRAQERYRKHDELYRKRLADYGALGAKENKDRDARQAPPMRPLSVAIQGSNPVRSWGTVSAVDGVGTGSTESWLEFLVGGDPGQVGTSASTRIRLCPDLEVEVAAQVSPAPRATAVQTRHKLALRVSASHGDLPAHRILEARRMAPAQARVAASALCAPLNAISPTLRGPVEALIGHALDALLARGKVTAGPQQQPPQQQKASQARAPHKPRGGIGHDAPVLDKNFGVALRGAQAFTARSRRHADFASMVARDANRERAVARLDKTMGSLATAAQKGLTSTKSAELREKLAQMDATLSRLKGQQGPELTKGAQDVAQLLSSMGSLASKAGNGAQLAQFKKLIDERRADVARLVGSAPSGNSAEVIKDGKHALQLSAESLGELTLDKLRRQHPGLDSLLTGSAREQLVKELGKGGGSGALGKAAAGFKHALGSGGLTGAFQNLGGAHLGGFGGGTRGALSALTGSSGLARALSEQVAKVKSDPAAVAKLMAKIDGDHGLKDVARLIAEKTKKTSSAPKAATVQGLREALLAKGQAQLASQLAPGGALHSLVETAQRSLRGPLDQAASHYLSSRGASRLYNSVATFQGLVGQGFRPNFSLFGSIKKGLSNAASAVGHAVSHAATAAASTASRVGQAVGDTVRSGVSNVGNVVSNVRRNVEHAVDSVAHRAIGAAQRVSERASSAVHAVGHGIGSAAGRLGRATTSAISHASSAVHGIADRASDFAQAARQGAGRAVGNLGQIGHRVIDYAGHRLHEAASAVKSTVGRGLDWARKTGVVGAVGGMLHRGVSALKTAASYSPIGLAMRAARAGGEWVKGGGLSKVWDKTKDIGGKAWGGIKDAGKAVGHFLQSPAGQLLVTGLSVAATFIPGGLLVKSLVGAGIGAISAISEGKDWKGVLLAAGSGALSAAVPFLKMGPLAKMGIGALQGAASAVMQGGSWKDALKGAAGGAMDNFSPGALRALKNVKGLTAAGKLLSGGKLSKLEQAAVKSGGLGGKALGTLQRTVGKPGVQRTMAKLQQFGQKAVKTGHALSGKAAKAQDVLDKALTIGTRVNGALEQVSEHAPELADMVGDNALGRAIRQTGDLAQTGSGALGKALDYGQQGSSYLSTGRDYLDRGLAMVPQGKKGRGGKRARGETPAHGLAEAHAEQTGAGDAKKGRGAARTADASKGRKRGPHRDTGTHEEGAQAEAAAAGGGRRKRGRGAGHPDDGEARTSAGDEHDDSGKAKGQKSASRLEKALAKGRDLQSKAIKAGDKIKKLGDRVSKVGDKVSALGDKVSGKLGQIGDVVQKGLDGAQKIQGGLEKASEMARKGAGYLGEDNELGQFLQHAADRADQIHGYVEQGIHHAETVHGYIQRGQGAIETGQGYIHQGQGYIAQGQEMITEGQEAASGLELGKKKRKKKGVHESSPIDRAVQLEGGSEKSEAKGRGKAKGKGPQAEHEPAAHDEHHEAGPKAGGSLLEKGLAGVQNLQKRAQKAGGKVDQKLQGLQGALNKGIKLGQKVDGGLQKAADLAHQVGELFGEDSSIGQMANQLGDKAQEGHEKVQGALELAGKGKRGLQAGRDLLHDVLGKGQEHHEQREESAEKSRRRGHPEPEGDAAESAAPEEAQGGRKRRKRRGHAEAAGEAPEGRGARTRADAADDAAPSSAPQRARKPRGGGRKGRGSKLAAPAGEAAEGKPSKGKRGKVAKLVRGAGKKVRAIGRSQGGALLRHLGNAALDAATSQLEDPAEEQQAAEEEQAAVEDEQAAADEAQAAQDEEQGPAGEDHAEVHEAAGGASDRVGEFVAGVTKGIPQIEALMAAGRSKEAHDLMVSLSQKSESARGMLTKAVAFGEKLPFASGLVGKVRQQYLDVRNHLFKFAGALTGAAGATEQQAEQGGPPEVTEMGADIDAYAMAVAALGDVGNADSGSAGEAGKLLGRGQELQSRLEALSAKYANDPTVSPLLGGLAGKLGGLMQRAGAASNPVAAAANDEKLGVAGAQKQGRKKRKKRSKKGGKRARSRGQRGKQRGPSLDQGAGAQVFVNQKQAARGDTAGEQPDQDVDPAAEDTWLGSGESTKFFADVFGRWLPAAAASPEQAQASDGGTEGAGGEAPSDGAQGGELPEGGAGEQAQLGDDAPEGDMLQHAAGEEGGQQGEGEGQEEGEGQDDEQQAAAEGDGGGGGLFGSIGKFLGAVGKRVGKFLGRFGGRRGKKGKGLFGRIGKFAKGIVGKLTKKGGMLSRIFGKLHGFADKIGGALNKGGKLLGKAMHFAQAGMGLANRVGAAADQVAGIAGKAEGFLDKMHLGGLAKIAGKVGGLADRVHSGADQVHGGLDTANAKMGSAKSFLKQASKTSRKASGAFAGAERGQFGKLQTLFRAGRHGDGIDGKLMPEQVRLGSAFDEPSRLDVATMMRMERFLGGAFGHVRVHTGPGAAEITRRYEAEAVTVREHIFFAPGRFNTQTLEGQKLLAHELTHVMQSGRRNLDVRTAETEALRSEHSYGAPRMETLNLSHPAPDFMLTDGAGMGMSSGIHTAKRTRSKKEDSAPLDEPPDGEEMLDKISERVYEMMMDELDSSLSER